MTRLFTTTTAAALVSFGLIALSGCGGATHTPPADRGTSSTVDEIEHAEPDAPESACGIDAPLAYQETESPMSYQNAPTRSYDVHTSGAWAIVAGGAVERSGCLDAQQYQQFVADLTSADFAAPAPMQIRCQAVTKRWITYRDLVNGRDAFASLPCGDEASAGVYELSTLVRHTMMGE